MRGPAAGHLFRKVVARADILPIMVSKQAAARAAGASQPGRLGPVFILMRVPDKNSESVAMDGA